MEFPCHGMWLTKWKQQLLLTLLTFAVPPCHCSHHDGAVILSEEYGNEFTATVTETEGLQHTKTGSIQRAVGSDDSTLLSSEYHGGLEGPGSSVEAVDLEEVPSGVPELASACESVWDTETSQQGKGGPGFPRLLHLASANLLVLALLYIIVGLRSLAAAESRDKEEKKAIEKEKAALQAAISQEAAKAEFTRAEVKLGPHNRAITQSIVEYAREMEPKLAAKYAKAMANARTAKEILERAKKSSQEAVSAQDAAMVELELADQMKGVSEEQLPEFLEKIRQEDILASMWLELLDNCIGLARAQTPEEASRAKQSHLAHLDEYQGRYQELMEELPVQKALLKQEMMLDKSLDEDIAGLEKQVEEAEQKISDQELAFGPDRKTADELTKEAMDRLRNQRKLTTKLREESAMNRVSWYALQQAENSLKENKKQLGILLSSKSLMPTDYESLELIPGALHVEEKQLLKAEKHLKALEDERALLVAEHEALKLKCDETVNNKNIAAKLLEMVKIPQEELLSLKDASEGTGGEEMKHHDVRMEGKLVNTAVRRALEKLEQFETNRTRQESVDRNLVVASSAVKRWGREVEKLKAHMELRMRDPMAFGTAALEELTRRMAKKKDVAISLRDRFSGFSSFIFDHPDSSTALSLWTKDVAPYANAYVLSIQEFVQDLSRLRLADAFTQDYLWKRQLIEDLQLKPIEDLMRDVTAGSEGALQKERVSFRLESLKSELSTLETQEQAIKQEIQELRTQLELMTDPGFWNSSMPQLITGTSTYIERQTAMLNFLGRRKEWLQGVTEGDVQQEVQQCFMDAVRVSGERLTRYGADPSILDALHNAHKTAIGDVAANLKKIMADHRADEETLAPAYNKSRFPTHKRSEDISDQPGFPARGPTEFGGEVHDKLPEPVSRLNFDDGFTGETYVSEIQ
ncbi:hypothetical protein cyc_07514 [Cyclospora cayetanensis]|uniref:Uncharacterized protein n=1 Tax=Cyclospora cayetanensis TaxID=88456 RepID=A0A1D3D8L6_9EIME|nr:hypothetical protein cyc_07514 [Cyclospora cayetanensis]